MSTAATVQNQDIFKVIKQQIPAYEIAQRYMPNELRKQSRRWVAHCPFHDDQTPSFYVNKNSCRCFGCGWYGDGVDLVAQLLNLSLIKAARLIAHEFHLQYTSPNPVEIRKLRHARQLSARKKAEEEKIFQTIAMLNRTLGSVLAGIQTKTNLGKYGRLFHIENTLETLALSMLSKDKKERAEALQAARKWLLY